MAKYIRSTPERRKRVYKIKVLLDEAQACRDFCDLEGFGIKTFEAITALAFLDPTNVEKHQDREELERKARLLTYAIVDEDRAYLDGRYQYISEMLTIFEDRMRIGFNFELTSKHFVDAGFDELI